MCKSDGKQQFAPVSCYIIMGTVTLTIWTDIIQQYTGRSLYVSSVWCGTSILDFLSSIRYAYHPSLDVFAQHQRYHQRIKAIVEMVECQANNGN